MLPRRQSPQPRIWVCERPAHADTPCRRQRCSGHARPSRSYALSIYKGDVPTAWLPMISDCLVAQPQSFISRIGLIGGATLGEGCILLFGAFLASATQGAGRTEMLPAIKFSTFTGCLACFCLAGVGAINEDEFTPGHDISAITLFVCFMLYVTFSLHQVCQLKVGDKSSRLLRWFVTIAASVDGFAAVALALIWNKTSNDWQIALCEWIGVFLITYTLQINVRDMGQSIELGICQLLTHAHQTAKARHGAAGAGATEPLLGA